MRRPGRQPGNTTTVQEGDRRVHVIKLLTKDGVVKVVRIPVRER
jgi:hypothetical protein